MTETSRPRALGVAAGVVAVEASAAVIGGLSILIAALVGHPSDRGVAVTLAALLLVVGAGLTAVARGVLHARPRARTPAYLAQFFALVVAWYQRSTLPAVSVSAAVVAVIGVVALSVRRSEP